MKNSATKQYEEAARALNTAAEALEHALEYHPDPENSPARWAKVRALQAHAQLHILHSISNDLEAIRDAIPENS
ncbi:hypothetical protein E3G52_005226 [Mycobacteroides abscessus]|uniref:hypothetical protein n=1 Tax=Mycobacteroides abscessus TaxID=36809 RepID=UPI000C25DB15|nr:hypothetical protein [Mycobacteroides abscessus]MBE5458318.1 hypothetical protein [Mycobacteroides abscessus]RIT15029.1 hypothetical protein D2E81_24910 [Mycobacteroides abscessus]